MKRFKDHKQFRYKSFDYSQNGFYFITICTKNRELLFGNIMRGEMHLSDIGRVAEKFWRAIPDHFPFVKLDEFVVMPNHIHGIIVIDKNGGAQNPAGTQGLVGTQDFAFLQKREGVKNEFGPQSRNLSSVIRGFKIGVTKHHNEKHIKSIWQPRFHDRIIRNEKELDGIRQYIIDNPLKWEMDKDNLENIFM